MKIELHQFGKPILGSDSIMYVDGRLKFENIIYKVMLRNERFKHFLNVIATGFEINGEYFELPHVSIEQMYSDLYENIKSKTFLDSVCVCITDIDTLKMHEKLLLKQHFVSQKPSQTQHEEFYNGLTFNKQSLKHSYWWSYKENWNPVNRITFVEKLKNTQWNE